MPRFDPDLYPDRLAFEAHARKIRAAEWARLWNAARASLRAAIQNRKYRWASGSTVAGSHASSSPSARTS
jgi:hypothetical protein